MLHAIALDDDRVALKILDTFCQQAASITLSQVFTRPSEARHYIGENRVDLVFLDAHLPTESGIAFWQSIRHYFADCEGNGSPQLPMVIFTTASSDYAVASYDLQAVDYLLKPFSFERFQRAVDKAATYAHWQHLARQLTPSFLSLRVDAGWVRVKLTDIEWIAALSNYLKIHLPDGRFLVVRMTMKAILEELPTTDFVRVHRSYIVPIHRVQAIHNKLIYIGENQVPLSSNYERDFYAHFQANPRSSQFSLVSSQT